MIDKNIEKEKLIERNFLEFERGTGEKEKN